MLKIPNRLLSICVIIPLLFCSAIKAQPSTEYLQKEHLDKENSNQRPNIIFIMSDDHSQRAISAYGSKLINTPNIDRIAQEGVLFKNSFVANSICGPSRAIMLTGKHSHINGFTDNHSYFNGNQPTYPQHLQDAGYQTAVVGKWHLHSDPVGFDYWEILRGQGYYYSPEFLTNTPTEMTVKKEIKNKQGIVVKTELENTYHGAYATTQTGDLALSFLKSRDKSKPFAMIYNHKAPHRNWMPNVDDLGVIDTSTLKVPANFYDDYHNRPAAKLQALEINDMYLSYDLKLTEEEYKDDLTDISQGWGKQWLNLYNRMTDSQKEKWDNYYQVLNKEYQSVKGDKKLLLEWKYRRYMHDYLSSIDAMDKDIGRVLDYLDEQGLAQNTLVVYTSDQGFFIGEHGWFDKRFMYEETMRTPLVARYPAKIKANQVVDEMVQNIDYAPTLLDFAGINISSEIQGVSLKPLLTSEQDHLQRDALYYHYYEGIEKEHKVAKHEGVRTATHKLIHFKDVGVDHFEMYDIVNDPSEMNNIYNVLAFKSIQNQLIKKLAQLKNNYNVPEEGK
ncbi:MAG: arylsulfatase A-like enzyme [Colwellia sp.]|jgi:arylsulfatase A-like enzyme